MYPTYLKRDKGELNVAGETIQNIPVGVLNTVKMVEHATFSEANTSRVFRASESTGILLFLRPYSLNQHEFWYFSVSPHQT